MLSPILAFSLPRLQIGRRKATKESHQLCANPRDKTSPPLRGASKRVVKSGLVALCLILSACATTSEKREPSSLLTGTWDNSAQMAAAPQALKRPPVAGGAYDWIDGQHATFFPATIPALTADGGKAIYLVWRNGGPTGPISRQRLWVFRTLPDGKTIMDFYAFKNPQTFKTATSGKDAFKAITLDDLTAYGPLCSLPVTPTSNGWRAAIPSTCAITARSGRKMVLSAQIVVEASLLSYSEQGMLDSGALAFKVPGTQSYQFVKK